MIETLVIILLALVLWAAFARRKRDSRDAAADAARRAVEAQLEHGAAPQREAQQDPDRTLD